VDLQALVFARLELDLRGWINCFAEHPVYSAPHEISWHLSVLVFSQAL
jgi:hypothetical protein